MRLPSNRRLQEAVSEWGLTIDAADRFGSGITALSTDPPLLRVENFLSAGECAALVALQRARTDESDLYLNYRVNREVGAAAASNEAAGLISEFSAARATLDASMRSGLRCQVAPDAPALQPVLRQASALMGFSGREFVFAEGMWRRPSRRSVVVRDQTTVKYDIGEGVAPHVDGHDATVLVCLQEPKKGGRTVFPEASIAVEPVVGAALVYRSKKGLLHFAEAVEEGQKWVLQLLIDFRVRGDEPDVDFGTGTVFS